LGYTIEFSNEKTAKVPADNVVVTEQLGPNLDWSTFQLGTIGFGHNIVNVPPGLTSYTARVDATATVSVYVGIAANLNLSTGLLTVTFTSLDPTTLDTPSNPLIGFLPPDINPPGGEGYINYTIQPKSGLATGAAVNAQASIVFDTNAPIATPQISYTIDAGTPASTVVALPPTEKSPNFTVSWSGSDSSGPGIARYDVYASDNGGPFTAWQSATTQTSATFKGRAGHTYRFYSVATDPLGFVQPTPSAPQATTKVVLPALLVTMTKVRLVMNTKQQVTQVLITFSGAVNAREAGNVATYHLATPGKGGSYTAKNAGIIKLKSAVYNPKSDTVTLTPTKPFALTKPVQLLVYGTGPNGLQDSHGRLIDGDHNGTAGGNATVILSEGGAKIQAVPLVQAGTPAPSRQAAETAAAIDALLERCELPGFFARRWPVRKVH